MKNISAIVCVFLVTACSASATMAPQMQPTTVVKLAPPTGVAQRAIAEDGSCTEHYVDPKTGVTASDADYIACAKQWMQNARSGEPQAKPEQVATKIEEAPKAPPASDNAKAAPAPFVQRRQFPLSRSSDCGADIPAMQLVRIFNQSSVPLQVWQVTNDPLDMQIQPLNCDWPRQARVIAPKGNPLVIKPGSTGLYVLSNDTTPGDRIEYKVSGWQPQGVALMESAGTISYGPATLMGTASRYLIATLGLTTEVVIRDFNLVPERKN